MLLVLILHQMSDTNNLWTDEPSVRVDLNQNYEGKKNSILLAYCEQKLASKRVFSWTPNSKKLLQYLSHRMFAAYAWSIKCRRKKKLIAQFGGKLRDERFEPN